MYDRHNPQQCCYVKASLSLFVYQYNLLLRWQSFFFSVLFNLLSLSVSHSIMSVWFYIYILLFFFCVFHCLVRSFLIYLFVFHFMIVFFFYTDMTYSFLLTYHTYRRKIKTVDVDTRHSNDGTIFFFSPLYRFLVTTSLFNEYWLICNGLEICLNLYVKKFRCLCQRWWC